MREGEQTSAVVSTIYTNATLVFISGELGIWTTRTQEKSYPCQLVPRTTRTLGYELSIIRWIVFLFLCPSTTTLRYIWLWLPVIHWSGKMLRLLYCTLQHSVLVPFTTQSLRLNAKVMDSYQTKRLHRDIDKNILCHGYKYHIHFPKLRRHTTSFECVLYLYFPEVLK